MVNTVLINYYTEEEFYVIYSIQIYTIFFVRILTPHISMRKFLWNTNNKS